jgi:hypothetical protein
MLQPRFRRVVVVDVDANAGLAARLFLTGGALGSGLQQPIESFAQIMQLPSNFSLEFLKLQGAQHMSHNAFLATGFVIVRIPLSVVETSVENLSHVQNVLREHTVSASP